MPHRIVIIGAGQAGAQAVTTLRAEGYTGAIAMIGDEPFAPYQRPPLSKAYLMGTLERARLFLKPEMFYQESDCELILDASACAINRTAKTVTLFDGRTLPFDMLLLATGARVRRIKCPGANLVGIHYLRGIADVDGLNAVFQPGKRLVIVGGGYIGLEVAAVAAKHSLDVTVFEAMDRVMARAVSKSVSDFFERVHRAAGVNLQLNTGVEAFEGAGRLEGVRAGGVTYPADIALVGVGVVPNMELALDAGLPCEDGIVVDRNCVTADPAIFAAGDCTWHVGREGIPLRLESVQNAIDQAKHAAYAMVGRPRAYSEVPWFWSDQYDLKLQIAGLARPNDQVVLRGDPVSRKFAVFHLRDGSIDAVEAVNAASEYLVGRKLIEAGTRVAPERLADTSTPMKNIV
ncbi:MAG: FAD-dependent oxidoreductase [Alphaproteobacteria bacterium]|nr:FAD-dependent oxidoreductase [Alphaproteobacteria bacterium]MDE2110911.1 FAD-dependent oxidoreductase [Alphaproteobacteria bacterium]MDE2495394.1 FAD-dependent oxidoreductase [Alphaproteobacteria bacterium]